MQDIHRDISDTDILQMKQETTGWNNAITRHVGIQGLEIGHIQETIIIINTEWLSFGR